MSTKTKIIIEGDFSPSQAAMALASFASHPIFKDFHTNTRIKAPKGQLPRNEAREQDYEETNVDALKAELSEWLSDEDNAALLPPGFDLSLSRYSGKSLWAFEVELVMAISGKSYPVGRIYQMSDEGDGVSLWGYVVDCNDQGGDCISSAKAALDMLCREVSGEFFGECAKYVRRNTVTTRKVRPTTTGKRTVRK